MIPKTTPLERRMLAFVADENAEGRKPSKSAVALFDYSVGASVPNKTKTGRFGIVTRLCGNGLLIDDRSAGNGYALVVTKTGREVLAC